jgi:hypothetical protein
MKAEAHVMVIGPVSKGGVKVQQNCYGFKELWRR